jgi:hypothetical protein
MKSRGTAIAAALAALALSVAGPAFADQGGGAAKHCTRSEQRTDTTRFETRMCSEASADRARFELRIEARTKLSTMAAAADQPRVRVRQRVRDEERSADMRVRVRTEHRVDGNETRDEVRVRIEVRNADHPQVTVGTATNGVLPITVTEMVGNAPVVVRTLTVNVPQAQ